MRKIHTFLLGAVASLTLLSLAGAQNGYPNKSIHLIVPQPPGGASDIYARQIAQKMSEVLGQRIVIENKAGASGNIGAEVVAIDPSGARREPVPLRKHAERPDFYEATVTPDVPGAWTFEIQAWSDPIGTWQHNAGLKIPAGVDVEELRAALTAEATRLGVGVTLRAAEADEL